MSEALRFLTPRQAEIVAAIAERIFPADAEGPGASAAGVVDYIDRQLAGSWGQGGRMYLTGPFLTPEDGGHGPQSPLAPADVYRIGLEAVDALARQQHGDKFLELVTSQQDAILSALQLGTLELGGIASAEFFQLIRQNVIEGLFADPAYGGNRDLIGWRWLGYPGDPARHGDYGEHIDAFDKPHVVEPKPMLLSGPEWEGHASSRG